MDQHGSSSGNAPAAVQQTAGDITACERLSTPRNLSVYAAEPGRGEVRSCPATLESEAAAFTSTDYSGYRDGFTGSLALKGVEVFDQDEAGAVLARLDHLVRWAQAQQARVLNRLEGIFRNGFLPEVGSGEDRQLDPGLAFSLAAEEAAAILHLPTGTAKMLMMDAGTLCGTHTATLQHLEAGTLGYGQVQTVLEQSQNIPATDLPGFEKDLLTAAGQHSGGLTLAQFRVKARRLRETRYPETIAVRYKSAFETRRVCLQPDTDGMSWLSAFLPAQRAQAIYTQLSVAARGEQAAGDPRPVDQLRADILEDLLTSGGRTGDLGSNADGDGAWVRGENDSDDRPYSADSPDNPGSAYSVGSAGRGLGDRLGRDINRTGDTNRAGAGKAANSSNGGKGNADNGNEGSSNGAGGDGTKKTRSGQQDRPVRHGSGARTEILVLITAETLLGANEDPAELHGYGPISAETARRLARQAARWTPVERDPHTEEILRVGRRRKVPPGLQRWLRARDGTCRFPGCRTNALISEIDHTTPWSHGGVTDHNNLEHLCRRHHMFKTHGFWKARQHSPGIIEWTSPGGRTYRTEPHLHLASGSGTDSGFLSTGTPGAVTGVPGVPGAASGTPPSSSLWGSPDDPDPYDYGDSPPPF